VGAGSSAVGDTWDAVRLGESGEVQRLVGQDPQLLRATRPHPGRTLLVAASFYDRTEVVRCLVDLGAALDRQKGDGATALYDACYLNRTSVVQLLVERGPTLPHPTSSNALP
jgi:ankyrin repeat protein